MAPAASASLMGIFLAFFEINIFSYFFIDQLILFFEFLHELFSENGRSQISNNLDSPMNLSDAHDYPILVLAQHVINA
jgi:hypothetical protein